MSYINTIDINGVIYNLGSLTDGDHEVNLPSSLNADDIFLLQGDVVNNLNGTQSNKPLSANQGRVLNEQIKSLREDSTSQGTNLGNEIDKLRTDMNTNDSTTLSVAKSYADDLKTVSDSEDKKLDDKITTLRTDMNSGDSSTLADANSHADTKCGETLTSAKKYTDDSCSAINKSISDLKSTVEGNKSSSDTGVSELRTYVDSTFIEKANIADDLSTNSAVKVLSAKQGKTLDDKKFNVSGGAITGNVTINGSLTMGNSNSITITKVPTANNDVANKKYVDDQVANCSIGGTTTTDAGWTYTKMGNGVAMAWGSFENSSDVGSSSEFSEAYPTGLFISAPVCTPFLYTSGQNVIQYSKNAGDKDNTPKIGVHLLSSLINPGTSETLGTIKVDYIAIGKWK